jgi:hypothetical protein
MASKNGASGGESSFSPRFSIVDGAMWNLAMRLPRLQNMSSRRRQSSIQSGIEPTSCHFGTAMNCSRPG